MHKNLYLHILLYIMSHDVVYMHKIDKIKVFF